VYKHGPDSAALLVTHSREVANQVKERLPDLINDLPENLYSHYDWQFFIRR
jgi:histidinol dehydrogenase